MRSKHTVTNLMYWIRIANEKYAEICAWGGGGCERRLQPTPNANH